MKIVILDGQTTNPGDNPWDIVEALGDVTVYDQTPNELILERSDGADILITNKTPLFRKTLERLDDLKFITLLATGVNNVDLKAAAERGIVVSNVPAYSTASVAQYTFALLLELCHHIAHHSEQVYAQRWTTGPYFCFWDTPQIELADKTIGIVGFGQIGERVAAIAHAMGMKVIATTRTPKPAPGYEPFEWVSLAELFARADVVSLHCPLTDDNAGFIDQHLLGLMKPTAFLINTSRGAIVNEQDLAEALNEQKIAGAGLDVVSKEPIRLDNPLLKAKNCVITPHIAWASLASRQRLMEMTAENIKAFMAGKPVNVVN
ncbi:MAG: D-2-hydroxyacid dehydrogenase [Chitinivibrionales bacterium]|nr:D-2-hydroxyacid dehydrogenase [Chitinivibrionales bacterium]